MIYQTATPPRTLEARNIQKILDILETENLSWFTNCKVVKLPTKEIKNETITRKAFQDALKFWSSP
jgi:hypothetical protein